MADTRTIREQTFMSGLINDRFLIGKVIDEGLKPFMFRSRNARNLFRIVFQMYDSRSSDKLIDIDRIRKQLDRRNLLTDEMEQYLENVMDQKPPQLSEMIDYVDELKRQAHRIRLGQINTAITEYLRGDGQNRSMEISDFTGGLIRILQEMREDHIKEKLEPLKYKMYELNRELDAREKMDEEITVLGYSIAPLDALNSALSGIRKGFYYGLAGAPRRGKTNLSLELASRIVSNNQIPVLFYSWEQTTRTLSYRLLAKESQINTTVLQSHRVKGDRELLKKLQRGWSATEKYVNYLYIIEAGQKDAIERIKINAYNTMHEFEKEDIVIFLDYLQKIPLDRQIAETASKIDELSSGLADLSLELNCPVFAVSSIDKEGCKLDERHTSERPTMHNCTGSGDIEYDLDVALILTKDWIETEELDKQLHEMSKLRGIPDESVPRIDVINLYIDKNRDAPEGTSNVIQYLFMIDYNKFIEIGYKVKDQYMSTYHKAIQLIEDYNLLA